MGKLRKIDFFSQRDFPRLGKIITEKNGSKWKVVSNEIKNVTTLEYVGK